MPESCNCPHEGKLSVVFDTYDWVKKLRDGNGHDPIDTRIKLQEEKTKNNEVAIMNLVETTEELRKTTSALTKVYEFERTARKEAKSDKFQRITNIISVIGIVIVALGLIYDMFIR